MNSYVILMLAVLLLVGQFALNKVYQDKNGTSVKSGFGFNSLNGLSTAIIFFFMNGFKFNITWYSLAMAVDTTILITAYTIIGFAILKSGGMSYYSLFLMTGGMTVPYIWGLLFLGEDFSLLRTLGLVLIFVAVAMANSGEKNINTKQIVLCVTTFILNGFVSVISKHHQIEQVFDCVSANEFVMLGGVVKFLMAGIAYFVVKEEKKMLRGKDKFGSLLIIFGTAFLGGLSYLLQLLGAVNIDATVLYPIITGGSMVFSTLAGIIFFRERPSKSVIVSVAICAAATLLFL